MVPFYMYYSMFGFQRIGDMAWAFADSRGKGFLMGGTAGRTTMLGEGLQHQDGHSPILSGTIPTCITYDPAYVYEMAVIIQDGLRGCMKSAKMPSTTSRCTTRTTPCPRFPRGMAFARHSARHLQVQGCGEWPSQGAALWQRTDSERGASCAADTRREVQRGRRCLECDQL